MSYRQEPYYRRRRSRRTTCLAWLVALIWVLLLGLLAYRYLIRPQISRYVGSQIGEQLRSNVGDQIQERAQQELPTVVAGLPSGELRIGEEDANQYFAAHADQLRPVDSLRVRFVPGEIQADIGALGTTSTARLGLAVQNGRVVALNPRIDGPLDQIVSLADLTTALEQQFNDQLTAQGRRATDVRIEQGVLIVTIEG